MFKTGTLLALMAVMGTSRAKINFEREFDDFPGFRYTPWDALPDGTQAIAENAGYTADTWDNMGTSDLEATAWSDLPSSARSALRNLGFREATWDCYVHHYGSYSWNDLVLEDLAETASVMGVSERLVA